MTLKCVCVLLTSMSFFQPLALGQRREATVVTKTSRPLVELAQALVLKEGWLVNYEDPSYKFPGDLIDVTLAQTTSAFRAANPGKIMLGVRSSPVTFTFPFRTSSSALSSPDTLISTLLAANEQAGNPGHFKVVTSGRYVEIVPDKVKNALGILESQPNVLDAAISFPPGVYSGYQIVNLIRDQLLKMGINVGVGTTPTNYLVQTEMTIGSNAEPARDVLTKMIGGLQWRDKHIQVPTSQLVWRVLYAPDLEKPSFMINLEIARTEVDTPTGGQVVLAIH